ncbi:MAG: hypothetical protein ACK50J_06935, partial [Planctomyces sp.]
MSSELSGGNVWRNDVDALQNSGGHELTAASERIPGGCIIAGHSGNVIALTDCKKFPKLTESLQEFVFSTLVETLRQGEAPARPPEDRDSPCFTSLTGA